MSIAAFIAPGAYAQISTNTIHNAGWEKLTEQQKAELVKQVADMQSQNAAIGKVPPVSADNIEKWVSVGKMVGIGLSSAAKELNIAVNDFANTYVGKITIAIIVWNVLGESITMIAVGIFIWIIGIGCVYAAYCAKNPIVVVYSKEKTNIFGNAVIESKHRVVKDTDFSVYVILSLAVLVIGATVIITST
jgi:hypothetical protein